MTSRPFRSFVALGDSLTEGVGDPLPRGGLRGWADRLAEGLAAAAPLRYANLARRSLVSREILERQLRPALDLRPDLASAIVGMNDAIRPGFDPEDVREPLEEMTGTLVASGAVVLTATLPDVSRLLPLPPVARTRIRDRLGEVNRVVRDISARYGTVLVDAEDFPDELRAGNWSIDRLHPNSRGHLLIARGFAARLSELRGVEIALPDPAAVRLLGAENARHARWLVRQVTGAQAARMRALLRLGATP